MNKKYKHYRKKETFAICGVPCRTDVSKENVTCPRCLKILRNQERIARLPELSYQSLVDTLDLNLPPWGKLSEVYKQKFSEQFFAALKAKGIPDIGKVLEELVR